MTSFATNDALSGALAAVSIGASRATDASIGATGAAPKALSAVRAVLDTTHVAARVLSFVDDSSLAAAAAASRRLGPPPRGAAS